MKFKVTKGEIKKAWLSFGGVINVTDEIELEGEPVDKCNCVGCEVKEKPKKIEEITDLGGIGPETLNKINEIIKYINETNS